jgi:hypothetical protein
LLYKIDFIYLIINIRSLDTRLHTRRSRPSAASVVPRRMARCNHIVNGPPINLLGHVELERRQAAPASGEFVILHGRFSGLGPTPAWVVADIVRMEDGVLAEDWDVIQDEAKREQSRSSLPMFGDDFPA